uniref:Spindle assembly abnormal protein 6 N-terminal domain-containing protein n=1 Tax=Strombidium rassoulzadegani TaxID=1082188 RepID=A0A7S3FUW2_9SPIT|mmetsp:Transcript_1422/g.2495  ORF Transcript_1422/g.2495 Transcript_1422/m.2495 type:complete len:168 (+) Transcript_1422:279-782(+)
MGQENDPGSVRFELTSEDDIFFHYVSDINEEGFKNLQAEQQLSIEFTDFLRIIKQMMDNVQNRVYRIELILDNINETADLQFQQDSEFRVDTLLTLQFAESSVETIKNSISYRINACQQLNMLVEERLKDICNIIEQKNPTLMKEIKKGMQQANATHNFDGHKIDIS